MAKLYGNRWEIVGDRPLGTGGQAHVFRVRDTSERLPGEYALKRVLNPARHERFRREIEAIKSLNHSNIIRLIDHSALDGLNESAEKQFLVTPIANGGDLSEPGKAKLYEGSVDGVVSVAKQLAQALHAAHTVNIIHRDVKPANILFTGNGHEVWLGDFGICLLRDETRLTGTDERVGPWAFMAPELESGRHLDVTPAADVYSLGKVLFYMFSGGTILPRERLNEPPYSELFLKGQRHLLLRALCAKMICPVTQRIQTMSEVLKHLEDLESWEAKAQLLPLNPGALASLHTLQSKAQQFIRVAAEEQSARDFEQQRLNETENGFYAWLEAELEKVSSHIQEPGMLDSRVAHLPAARVGRTVNAGNGAKYWFMGGRSLSFAPKGASSAMAQNLEIVLCSENHREITFGESRARVPAQATPAADFQLCMLALTHPGPGFAADPATFRYLTRRDLIGRPVGIIAGPLALRATSMPGPLGPTTVDFLPDISQSFRFKTSEWPLCQPKLGQYLADMLESFFSIAGASS